MPFAGIGGVLLPLTFAVEPDSEAGRVPTCAGSLNQAHAGSSLNLKASGGSSSSTPAPTRPYLLSFVGEVPVPQLESLMPPVMGCMFTGTGTLSAIPLDSELQVSIPSLSLQGTSFD